MPQLRSVPAALSIPAESDQGKFAEEPNNGNPRLNLPPHLRSTDSTDFSELELCAHGRMVLVIGNGAGFFEVVTYEPGAWDWPEPFRSIEAPQNSGGR